jgi:ribosomal protein S18 acetylase RimI-like enzyme
MKTLNNAKQVSEGLGILSIKEIVSKEKANLTIEDEMKLMWEMQMTNKLSNPRLLIFTGDNERMNLCSTNLGLICYSHPKYVKDYCYIRNLYIAPYFRGKGYGKQTIESLISYFKSNFNICKFEVEADNDSIEFWSKLGFKLIENETNNRMSYE